MTSKTIALLHRVARILISLSLVTAGICLIAGCLAIYHADAYSREEVADTFAVIAVPVYMCLALILIGFLLDFFYKIKEIKKAPKVNDMLLERLQSKKDFACAEASLREAVLNERRQRRVLTGVCAGVVASACLAFLAYSLNPANFTDNINASVIRAMWVLIPCLTVAFITSVAIVYANERSIRRELELLKSAADAPQGNAITTERPQALRTAVLIGLLVLSIGAAIYGFLAGGTADVLTKAINICTECIGLG